MVILKKTNPERKFFMKKAMAAILVICTVFLASCYGGQRTEEGVEIHLSDTQITVDGQAVSSDDSQAVYAANDIVYYEAGRDFTYGEGTDADAHTPQEAAEHTVVHITQPGRYILSGKLSRGQIAVDLGEDAEDDPNAVVTLVLNGADITCTVAPAVIFYNVYECGDKDISAANMDTSRAGANVVIADGTVNNITGSYVARIYKPESVELNEDGTQVEDAKKLHKYDGAFYSKMSMNVDGDTGVLNINAANEGLDTELHLTINGGEVNIVSGNDGINTNEDGVSVTTINGGRVNIRVDGATGEGDGIDSNGYLVINGGTVIAQACSFSADAGIDSDMGIHINGGTVVATGNMLDHIAGSEQNYAVFQFAGNQQTEEVVLKDAAGQMVVQEELENEYSCLVISAPTLEEGEYTLWLDGAQMQVVSGQQMGGGMQPGGMMPPEGMEPPEGMQEGMEPPGDMPQKPEQGELEQIPQGEPPRKPDGMEKPAGPGFGGQGEASGSDVFSITPGGNYFRIL